MANDGIAKVNARVAIDARDAQTRDSVAKYLVQVLQKREEYY